MRRPSTLFAGVLLAIAAFAATAKGQLQAGPTLVELPAGSAAGRMTLDNSGDAPLAAQVRIYAWSQVDGVDRLEPTGDVVASPAISEIAAGGEQVVRLVRQGAAPAGVDLSYRVVVEELPGEGQDNTVNIRMRYVIPMFLRAADAPAPVLACRIAASQLTCTNSGGRAAQLGASRLKGADGHEAVLSGGLYGYVLPGMSRRWALDPTQLAAGNASLVLETQINGQSAALPVSRSP
ncbi:MAG: fimbria/pilus periplasmic chaperone [Luteimonas sp.]|nr:fimbria/pilus periplasmic chaperone [Luteimonas sp.]